TRELPPPVQPRSARRSEHRSKMIRTTPGEALTLVRGRSRRAPADLRRTPRTQSVRIPDCADRVRLPFSAPASSKGLPFRNQSQARCKSRALHSKKVPEPRNLRTLPKSSREDSQKSRHQKRPFERNRVPLGAY